MSFWIKKYKIELERLPTALLTKSILVVFLCISILTSILLLLPIQDTIKGDVVIYSKGQPLAINAPTSGFLHLVKKDDELHSKGDLLATIDVDISQSEYDQLKNLILNDLAHLDFNNTRELIRSIEDVTTSDFKEINNELFSLVDLVHQLEILQTASDPVELIATLDRSIKAREIRAQSFNALNSAQEDILKLIREQLRTDSLLWLSGGLSERDYQEQKRQYIDKKTVIIENTLRQQEIGSEIIQDEKEKFTLTQQHNTKIEELRLGIVTQLGIIRQKYQEFIENHIIIAPVKGYGTLPYDIVNQEYINEGEPIMLLSQSQKQEKTSSEMFIISNNAGKIKPGMMVRIGLSEFDQKEYGIYYTSIKSISDIPQNGKYKVLLECSLPITTSYNIELPQKDVYNGKGEVLIGKINLFTKISREIQFNKTKYASL